MPLLKGLLTSFDSSQLEFRPVLSFPSYLSLTPHQHSDSSIQADILKIQPTDTK